MDAEDLRVATAAVTAAEAAVGRVRSRASAFGTTSDSVFSYENGEDDGDEDGGGDEGEGGTNVNVGGVNDVSGGDGSIGLVVGGVSGGGSGPGNSSRACEFDYGIESPELREKVRRLVLSHNTMETALDTIPTDRQLCGLWEGLVLTFRVLFPIAIKHAEHIGEELQVRLDRSGNEHPKLVCRYSGKSRRRVSDALAKRRRHTVRSNCTWGATLKVLNFNRLKADNPHKAPSEFRDQFVVRISKWNRKHTGHIPAPLNMNVGNDAGNGVRGKRNARLETRIREDVVRLRSAGLTEDEIIMVLLLRFKADSEYVGRHNVILNVYPKIAEFLSTGQSNLEMQGVDQ